MKKNTYLLIIIAICLSVQISAQIPQAIPYQAVARDNSGNLIANQNIAIRFTIHDATASGTAVYQESHHPTTNELGLFSVNVGQGSQVTGSFFSIKWEKNAKFLQVELDAANGTNFANMGTQQMLSVPYALHADKSAGILDSLVLRDSTGNVRMVMNPNTGVFKMMNNDTVWYSIEVNSPPTTTKNLGNGMVQEQKTVGNTTTFVTKDEATGQVFKQETFVQPPMGSTDPNIHSLTEYDSNGMVIHRFYRETYRYGTGTSTYDEYYYTNGVTTEHVSEINFAKRDSIFDPATGQLIKVNVYSYGPFLESTIIETYDGNGNLTGKSETFHRTHRTIYYNITDNKQTSIEPGNMTVASPSGTNKTSSSGSEQKNSVITFTNGIDLTDPNGLTGGFSCTEDATGNQSSVQIKPSQLFIWTPTLQSTSSVINFTATAYAGIYSGTSSLVVAPSLLSLTGPFSLNTGPNSFNVTPTGASWAGTLSLSGPISSTNLTIGSLGFTVTGPTSLNDLNVSGSSVFNGLTVNGTSNFSGLTVSGSSNLSGCTITGGLTVSGGAAISGPSVGLTSGTNSFTVTPTFGNFTGTLSVTGPTTLTNGQNTISVFQRVQLQSGSNEIKVDPIDGFTVTGPTSMGGSVTVSSPTGIIIPNGGLSASGNVSGGSFTGGTITITGGGGASIVNGGLTASGNVSGGSLTGGSINISGAANVGGTVTVTGGGGVNITTGGLTAVGPLTGGSVSAGSINVTGPTNAGGTVTVTSAGGVNITTGGLTAAGPITGGSLTGGTINVTGAGGISIPNGGLSASGNVSAGSINVSGATNAGGTVTVTSAGGINITTGGLTAAGTVSAGSLSGNGGSITLINGSNISTGTINDARLSSNIPKLNQPAVFAGPLAVNLTTPGQDAIIGAAFGQTPGAPSNLAGKFYGNVNITGNLTKGGGTFKIDHPLDPKNKFLYHSFVESPDMMNIYTGTVALDINGKAVVELPDWFESLNKDFHYQLTCIGGFAQVYIDKEISNNAFEIAGGKQGMKVSWQVTGVRHDAYAEKHRVIVEEEKPIEERGKYLHPEAFEVND